MGSSPYRVAAEHRDKDGSTEPAPDRELIPVFAILWITSVARVVLGLVQHEAFGQESTLAIFAVLLLPVLVKDALRLPTSRAKRSRVRRR